MKDGADGPIRVRVAGRTYTVELQDERDRLMATLGLGAGAGAVAPELRAPMPGLVLNVLMLFWPVDFILQWQQGG